MTYEPPDERPRELPSAEQPPAAEEGAEQPLVPPAAAAPPEESTGAPAAPGAEEGSPALPAMPGPELTYAPERYEAGLQEEPWQDGLPDGPQAPPLRPRGAGLASGIAVVMLALGLLGLTAFALRLNQRQAQATAAASQLLSLISERAPAELTAELSGIQADLASGSMESATQRIARLRAMSAQSPAGGAEAGGEDTAAIPEKAYKDLTPDAATFFRANEGLFRRFLMMCTRAKELRDQGQNVDRLRKAREEILEAARLGQKELVQQKMLQMAALFGGRGAGRGRGNEAQGLIARFRRLGEAIERAGKQGRDPRAALLLARKAEEAGRAHDLPAARKFIDQAFAALRRAPRLSAAERRRLPFGGRGGRGGMPRGANPLAPVVRGLLSFFAAEDQDLRLVFDQLLNARSILQGDKPAVEKPELLKPFVNRAMGQMQIVAARRKEVQQKLSAAAPGRRGAGPGPGRRGDGAGALGRRPGMRELVGLRLAAFADRIRTMSDEDYARDKLLVIREALTTLLSPPTPAEQAELDKLQPGATPAAPLSTQARAEAVRARMLQASPVLRKWEIEGKDTTVIEDLFSRARTDLYAGRLEEAEKAVAQAMALLGLTPPPALGPSPRAGNGTAAGDDGVLRLDLREH